MTTFTAETYDVMTDRFRLKDYTRESLLDEVVRRSIVDIYHDLMRREDRRGSRVSVMKRLLKLGLDREDVAAINERWNNWWKHHEGKVYEPVELVPLRG